MITSQLLGPLESEVMEILWAREQATVREVVEVLQQQRPIAYTTVMTIMNNLVHKGLLEREPQGKAYLYRAALTWEAFREQAFRKAVNEVLERFGEVSITRFIEAAAELKPEYLERLQQLARANESSQPSQPNEGVEQ